MLSVFDLCFFADDADAFAAGHVERFNDPKLMWVALFRLVSLEAVEFLGQELGLRAVVEVARQFASECTEVALH